MTVKISFANVTSTTGSILFDVNNSGNAEASLTTSGLGIGTTPSSNLHVLGNVIISNSLMIGTSSANSTLEVAGSMGFSTETISSNTALSGNSIVLIDSSSGNLNVSLPYAANVSGRVYSIKKISTANDIRINGGRSYIDDKVMLTMSANTSTFPYLKVISNGTQWYTLDQSSAIDQVSSDNLVGWWRFDETSGNTVSDSSGSGNTAYANNMNDADWVSGVYNNALDFDGSNDYVQIGGANDYAGSGMSSLTICAWFNLLNVVSSNDAVIIDKFWNSPNESYVLMVDNTSPN